ncbi:MAG: ComEA family DNA-binding protein [Ornithinibacter sp.]
MPTEADLFGSPGDRRGVRGRRGLPTIRPEQEEGEGETRAGVGTGDGAGDGGGGRAGGRAGGRHGAAAVPRRWVRMPHALASARWQPRGAAVVGVVIICMLVAAVLGVRVAWARSTDAGTVIAPGGGSRAGPVSTGTAAQRNSPPSSGGGSGTSAGDGATEATPAPTGVAPATALPTGAGTSIVVHVVGQVRSPGVLRLPAGSRVSDAVAAAGGATARAELSGINLARLLLDGEQVRVPAPGEEVQEPAAPGGGGGAGAGGGGGGGSGATGGVVSLNTADLAGLDTLPGVGPVLAARILDWRVEHGRFTSVDELSEVSGIGEKLLARLRPLVSV